MVAFFPTATHSHRLQCFWCDKCNKFRTNKTTHKCARQDPSKTPRPRVACPICMKSLDRYALLEHIKRKHPENDVEMYRAHAKPGKTPEEKARNRQEHLAKIKQVKRDVHILKRKVSFFMYLYTIDYYLSIQIPFDVMCSFIS